MKELLCPHCGASIETLAVEEFNRRMFERRAAGGRISGKTGGKTGGKISGKMKTAAQTATRKSNVQKMNAANTPEARMEAVRKGWKKRRKKGG